MTARDLQLPGGVTAVVLVRADESDGALTVLHDEAPPGWRLPPHRHATESETIHITSGCLWMVIDGQRRTLSAGDTAHIPAGVLHEGGTEGDETVQRLVVFSPGGMERLFEQLAQPHEPADALALALRFGWIFS